MRLRVHHQRHHRQLLDVEPLLSALAALAAEHVLGQVADGGRNDDLARLRG